jgi:hypothetical protein
MALDKGVAEREIGDERIAKPNGIRVDSLN